MPISNKKKNSIAREAATLSQSINSVEGAEAFEKDYTAIMVKLNEQLENRLDDFRSEAIPIMREAYQSRPSGVLSVISEETETIRDLTQVILHAMEKIKYVGFRLCAAECIKDCVDICTATISESHSRAFQREKGILQ
jgi:hypothetical protein